MTAPRPAPRQSHLAYWCFQLLFWGGYCALGLMMTLPRTGPQPVVIGGYVLFFGYSIALTQGLRRHAHRREWFSLTPGRAVVRFAGAAGLLGLMMTVLILLIQGLWLWTVPWSWPAIQTIALGISVTGATVVWTALYVGGSSLLRARRARQRAVQLELAMREARLKALETQLGPHFLFNCLNTLRGLIVENPPIAQDVVTRLANILRHHLSRDSQPWESLQAQVDLTTDYLALEALRFEERIRTRFEIPSELLPRPVPAMLLQTLVENAVKHGIALLPAGGEIRVWARPTANEGMELGVENTGTLRGESNGSTRVGLRNLRERLRVLCGEGAALTLAPSNRGTVLAQVTMPGLAR